MQQPLDPAASLPRTTAEQETFDMGLANDRLTARMIINKSASVPPPSITRACTHETELGGCVTRDTEDNSKYARQMCYLAATADSDTLTGLQAIADSFPKLTDSQLQTLAPAADVLLSYQARVDRCTEGPTCLQIVIKDMQQQEQQVQRGCRKLNLSPDTLAHVQHSASVFNLMQFS
jgi:hypothetical protein